MESLHKLVNQLITNLCLTIKYVPNYQILILLTCLFNIVARLWFKLSILAFFIITHDVVIKIVHSIVVQSSKYSKN